MRTFKRSAAFAAKASQKCARTTIDHPVLADRPVLADYIVVLSHAFPIEKNLTDQKGYLRGLGNTFTLEVKARDSSDAVICVQSMFNIDFETSTSLMVSSVTLAPPLNQNSWEGPDGQSVRVLSSRYATVRDGETPQEELMRAANQVFLRGRHSWAKESLERQVIRTMAEAETELEEAAEAAEAAHRAPSRRIASCGDPSCGAARPNGGVIEAQFAHPDF